MIYFFLLFLIIFLVFVFDVGKRSRSNVKQKKIAWNVICVLLIIISAIKYRVGSDVVIYTDEYKEILPITRANWDYIFDNFNRQFGWMILVTICKSITPSFLLPQIIISIFVNSAIFNFIKSNTEKPFVGLLLFYLIAYVPYNFEVLRQSIAIAFFIMGIKYYKDSKWFKYYLCVLGGFAFHSSAVVLALIPLFKLVPITKASIIWELGIGVVGIILLPFFINYIPNLINSNEALFGAQVYYANKSSYEVTEISYFGNVMLFFINYVITLFLCKEKNQWYRPFVMCYLYFNIINLAFPILYRFSYYFLIFYILGLCKTITFCKFEKHLIPILIILFVMFNTYRRYNVDWLGIPAYRQYYPYHTYFDPVEDSEREIRCF